MSVERYLSSRCATSSEMQGALGLTARQVGLQIKKLGDRIVKIKNGRSPLYALSCPAFGEGDSIIVWEVDQFGKHTCIARIRPLCTGGFFVEGLPQMPRVFLGESGNGLYDDLPFFLADMAPQGYLGRKVAKKLAEMNNSFPAHLSDWNAEHVGRYLLANTDGSVGNLKFGNNANLNIRPSTTSHSRKDYLGLADETIYLDSGGSSAGGEQQKFTTWCEDINSHVLVKFSPKGDSENARRWKDILITEHYAAQVVATTGNIIAAETHLFEEGGRIFLESRRFDRVGMYGRNSMFSLSIIDAEFVGSAKNWESTCYSLYQQDLLSRQDFLNVEFLSIFAKYINNTDTHLGNISFSTHRDGFALLPIYDMCSMGFSPKSNGEVTAFEFIWPKKPDTQLMDVDFVINKTYEFWGMLVKEPLISSEFRQFIFDEIIPKISDDGV